MRTGTMPMAAPLRDRFGGRMDAVARADSPRLGAGVGEPFHDRRVQARGGWRHQQLVLLEVRRRERASRKRHRAAGKPSEDIGAEELLGNVGSDCRLRYDRDVECLIVQPRAHHAGVADEDGCADGRILLFHPLEEFRQANEGERFVDAQSQRAFERIARVKTLNELSGRGEHPIRVLHQCMAFRGQAYPRPAPHKERRLERGLQLPDPLGDARLRQFQFERRCPETAETNDALERAQLTEGYMHHRQKRS